MELTILDAGMVAGLFGVVMALIKIMEKLVDAKMRPKDSNGHPVERRTSGSSLTEGERAALYGTNKTVDELGEVFLQKDDTGANKCLKQWESMRLSQERTAEHQEKTADILELVAQFFENERRARNNDRDR